MGGSAHRRELQREREALIRAMCGGEQGAGGLQRDMREGTIGHLAGAPSRTNWRPLSALQSSSFCRTFDLRALILRATIQISRFSGFVENRHITRARPSEAQFGRLGRPEATGHPAHINLMVFSGACSRPFSDSKNRNFVLFPELAPLVIRICTGTDSLLTDTEKLAARRGSALP